MEEWSPPPHPLSGTSSSIKLRHKKRQLSFGQSSIRRSQLTNGGEESRRRLTKVSLIVVHGRWNQLKIGSTVVHWLNMYGDICPIRGTLAHGSPVSMLRCLFYQPLCKTLTRFSHIWFFLRSGFSLDYLAPTEWWDFQQSSMAHWENTSSHLERVPKLW